LKALIADAGLAAGDLQTYQVSHMIAPRLNAMGRIEHAIDALRLLCTPNRKRAGDLARKLGLTNKERQQMTEETTQHALQGVALQKKGYPLKKLIFISHKSYNQGIIGLVAGKLVEEYYRPAIVVSVGETYSKASARSISGFNIVEAIRSVSDILVDVGGHPMAAGFTVETKLLNVLQTRLEQLAEERIDEDMLTRTLRIDAEIPLNFVSEELFLTLRHFEPFGFGNPEPVFATQDVVITDARLVGANGKHLKLRFQPPFVKDAGGKQFNNSSIDAIAFNFGSLYGKLQTDAPIDIAYTIDMDTWNGRKRLQLKIRDIQMH
jgi:single-stranded-DNA-specific exonuclease